MKLATTKLEALATVLFLGGTALTITSLFPPLPPRTVDPLPHVESEASLGTNPSALPSHVGPSFEDDRSLPVRAIPVVDYTFEVSVDTDLHTVTGAGTILWRNRSARSIDQLYLHLYANAFRSEKTTFLSDRRPGGRGVGPIRDHGNIEVESFSIQQQGGDNLWPTARPASSTNPDDQTDMRLPLPEPIEPGAQVLIDIKWRTKLPAIVERSGYHGSFHMVAQWFPKLARLEPDGTFAHFSFDRLAEFYADFGSYDVTISVPANFVVGATGPRLTDEVHDGRRVVRHVQSDIHDFAFCAYDGFEELRSDVDGVEVRVLYPRGHEANAREQLETAAFGLRYYGRQYGVYPYPTLTLVNPPPGAEEAGGMEYPTLITTGGRWWKHGNDGSSRALTLHELAHQYFYGLVATNERRWPFLDEGLTTFAEVDALDEGWGDAGGAYLPRWGLRASTVLRHTGVSGGQDDVVAKSATEFVSGYTYGRLVYARAALVLETLDRVYEGALRRALGRYARRYRFEHPTPEHLLEVVRDTIGDDAERALRTCLFDRGWIDVAVNDLACSGGSCTLVVTRRGNVQLPIEVAWMHLDGTETITIWDGKAQQTALTLETSEPVVGAILDPRHKVMLDEDFANNAIRRGDRPNAWRTRAVTSFVAALGLSVVSP